MKTSLDQRNFEKILKLMRQSTGVDFTQYKEPTLRRRMMRRMAQGRFKSLGDYARRLQSAPAEIKALYHDMLIPVTNFFRDPSVFEWLEKNFLPQLAGQKKSAGPIRVWVPACSTGEEAYSLTILLTEWADRTESSRSFQVFGTDINETALEKARAGIYDEAIAKQMSPARLRRFFDAVPGGFRVHENLRDACIFARQDLAADAPISNLDLISCRNVLIYFKPALQQRIIPALRFGLKPTGLLLLGSSESVGTAADSFFQSDPRIKAYGKKVAITETAPAKLASFPLLSPPKERPVVQYKIPASPKRLSQVKLREAIDKAILRNGGLMPRETRVVPVDIPESPETVYLVFTEEEIKEKNQSEVTTPPDIPPGTKAANREIERLRKELATVRRCMQTIIEQQDATNEELRTANEEIVSSNEELQNTNEELETAKEELQSVNEELTTVNSELEKRNIELESANLISSRFQAIVESSDDAIIAKDLNGIIQTWNRGAQKIFGYTAEEVIGKSVTILIPPEHQDEEPAILARVRAGEGVDHYETIRRRKDGQLIDISLTVSPIKNSAGHIVGASKIARDITDQKRATTELKRAHDETARINQAKDDFLAMLSHELRTPLNPVLLIASDAVADPELPPGIRANFDLIRRSIEMECKLIDDLLDLTRIKTGKLHIEKQEINIHDAVASAITMVQGDSEQKRITISRRLESAQSMVLGDKTRLHQIFWNVLKNAIKFSPAEGKVTVHAAETRGWYVVTITDTGIGMTPLELTQVFEPFRQGEHSANSRRFGGLGLGLAITKRLVELHGGVIEASSKGRDLGSTFTIRFPLFNWKTHSHRNDDPNGHTQPHGGRLVEILLVEDHEATRSTLARLLMNRRHKVTVAETVQEALSATENKKFDLVISDIGLPDGNGYDLFNQIRNRAPMTKGIALSGYGMREDINRSKESGFCAHLVKPIDIRALEKVLAIALAE